MGLKNTLNRTTTFFQNFGTECKGGVAMMVGLTFPMLFIGIGGALDYSNAIAAKQKAQRAMDATVLSLTRLDLDNADIQADGQDLFLAMMQDQGLTSDVNSVNFTLTDTRISGSALVDSQNFFLGFVGKDTTSALVEASAIPPDNRPLEIALVLDVSGSMSQDLNGASRLDRLKDAVNEMFDTLDENVPTGTEIRASVVPYSTSVNISNFPGAAVNTSVGGFPQESEIWAAERFVASTGTDFVVRSANPNVERFPFVTSGEINTAAPSTRMTGLTNNINEVRNTVASMTPNGWTAAQIGMAWGVYSLSENWSNFWPTAPEATGDSEKIIVFLSDGIFNTTHNIGAQSNNDGDTSNAYFQNICTLARDEDMTIYTIALALDAVSEARLTQCVGSSGTAFSASNAAELSEAFQSIARLLGAHRLTS